MTILDIINKRANGEELPEIFSFADQMFVVDGEYIRDQDGDGIFESIFDDFSNINDEIKIIRPGEKNKTLEPLEIRQDNNCGNYYILNEYNTKCYMTKHSKIIADKLNEVINHLKENEK